MEQKMNNNFIDKNFVDETAGIMNNVLTEDNQKEYDKFLGGDLLTEGKSSDVTARIMAKEPIIKGKVRTYDAKQMKGIIIGDDGVFYDIRLNIQDKESSKLSSKIKKGMKIKFKDLDVEPPMAYLGKFSFDMKESLDEGKVAYSLYLGDKKKFLTGIMGTEKSTKSELIAKARKEFEIVDRDSLAYLKNPKNINVYVDKGKDLVKADIKEK